jgi:hypothetical protein
VVLGRCPEGAHERTVHLVLRNPGGVTSPLSFRGGSVVPAREGRRSARGALLSRGMEGVTNVGGRVGV